jgi:hypothetical protein
MPDPESILYLLSDVLLLSLGGDKLDDGKLGKLVGAEARWGSELLICGSKFAMYYANLSNLS